MSKHKFTPGPWNYRETPNDADFVGEIEGICAIYVGDEKADADAKLISKAPELLEELIRLGDVYTKLTGMPAAKANALINYIGEE
jgi:hypothetical protein